MVVAVVSRQSVRLQLDICVGVIFMSAETPSLQENKEAKIGRKRSAGK